MSRQRRAWPLAAFVWMLLLVGCSHAASSDQSTGDVEATPFAASDLPGESGGGAAEPGSAAPNERTVDPDSVPGEDGTLESISGDGFADEPARPDGLTAVTDLTRLTEPGCCTQPFWGPDSDTVYFIDRREGDEIARVYGLEIGASSDARPVPVLDVARYSEDLAYRVDHSGGSTVLTRVADGQAWSIPSAGENIALSPNRTAVVWERENDDLPFERSISYIWVSAVDGTNARQIATLARGGLIGWLDEERLLARYRPTLDAEQDVLAILHVDGRIDDILSTDRLRGTTLSPERSRLVYYVTGDDDPAANGIWILDLESRDVHRLPSELFGAFRWRDEQRLLLVPMEPGSPSHRLLEYDARSRQVAPVTDPATFEFEIANGDWEVSPDGTRVMFVSARDKAIWMFGLPSD